MSKYASSLAVAAIAAMVFLNPISGWFIWLLKIILFGVCLLPLITQWLECRHEAEEEFAHFEAGVEGMFHNV